MAKNDLIIEIKANTKQALKEIEQLKAEINKFSNNVAKNNVALKEQETQLSKIAAGVKKVVIAYAGFEAIKGSINIVASFEQSIAKLGAISGASKENLEKLKQKAEELGKSTQFSASEVAEGMNYLAMAGYKTKDIMASIGDVLNLAQVGMIDLGKAADIASNILSGFGMSADETKRVVDVMTATITNANTNIPELGEAMKYVAPQAKALGVSLEETATALAVLSNSGLKATIAGTGLSTMLVRLSAPTGAAADALDKLGIKIYDSKGRFLGLENVLKQFHDKMKNMSQEMKAKYMRDIFGLETLKTATKLIDSIGGDYERLYKKISDSMGISEKKAKEMTDTFYGHLKELESALQGLAITIGQNLLPALTDFVKFLTSAVQNTEAFYKEYKPLINTLTQLTAIFIGLGKLKGIIESVLGAKAALEISKTAMSVGKLKEAFAVLGAAIVKLGKANAVLIALTLAIEGINYAFDKWEERIERVNKATQNLQDSNKDFNSLLDELKKHMDFSDGKRKIQATAQELQKLKDRTKELIKANDERIKKLKELMKEGTNDNEAVKRELNYLIERNKILQGLYTKLKNTKPYEKAKESAKDAEKAVRKLTAAEKKELEEIKKTYNDRIKAHEQTINALKQKEENLANEIIEINKHLQEELKRIENERIIAVEEIDEKIHSLQLAGTDSYTKYVDTKRRADEYYAKAKKELEKGNFELARHYMQQYRNEISALANKEIKENGRVLISKQQANQVAIEELNKLKNLTNAYYKEQEEKARVAANEKLKQLKAELEATKAQLQLEVQRLNLEKQMIELLTGKKVNIDTTEALNAVKKLDSAIKNIDKQINTQKKVKVSADTQELNKKVDEALKKTPRKTDVKVNADTKKAKKEIFDLLIVVDKKTGKEKTIVLNSNTKEAVKKINDFDAKVKSIKPEVKVKSDVSEALNALNKIPKTITTIHYIKTVETHAAGGLIGKYANGGMPEFKRVNGKIPGYDPFDKDDVPALLTRGEFVLKRDAVKYYGEDLLWKLNAKILPKFATGGLVDVGKLGESNFDYRSNSDTGDNSDLIDKIKDLLDKLSGYYENLKNSPLGEKIKNEYGALNSDIKIYTKNASELANLKNSIKGKTLSKNEYENYEKKIKQKEKEIEKITKKAEKDAERAEKLTKKIENYLKEVEKYKTLIKNRINKFGLEEADVLPDDFDYVTDLGRLKSFYSKLTSAKIPTPENLKIEFQRLAYKTLQTEPEYLSAGWSLVNNYNYKPIDYSALARSFLQNYGVRDELLEYRFKNLLQYNKAAATLSDDNVKILMKDILKKYLPKFKTGGLFKLQNGGKLPGYGGGDRNLALLEDGEFVIRKEAVSLFGADLFEKLNSLKLPKFATGGFVGSVPNARPANETKINFTLPSGNSYELISSEEVAIKLAQEFKRMM